MVVKSLTKTCYYSRITRICIVIHCLTKKWRNRKKRITINKMYNQLVAKY